MPLPLRVDPGERAVRARVEQEERQLQILIGRDVVRGSDRHMRRVQKGGRHRYCGIAVIERAEKQTADRAAVGRADPWSSRDVGDRHRYSGLRTMAGRGLPVLQQRCHPPDRDDVGLTRPAGRGSRRHCAPRRRERGMLRGASADVQPRLPPWTEAKSGNSPPGLSGGFMYFHVQQLINDIEQDEPDPAAANALQEGLGGQFGEMRTMMQYLFQSINFRGPSGKPYKDLLQGIGTEEISHVELIGTTISRLLDGSPRYSGKPTDPVDKPSAGGAVPLSIALDHSNIHHYLVGAQGALPVDAAGNPWMGSLRLQLRQPRAGSALQPHARIHRSAAEVPDLRDDGEQDRTLDDRVPDRPRPGARERLRQGTRDSRRELAYRAADSEDERRVVPRGEEAASTWGFRTSSTRSI